MNYKVDKINKPVDVPTLGSAWPQTTLEDDLNSLGNSIVLDMPQRNTPVVQRFKSYSNSQIEDVTSLISSSAGYTRTLFESRMCDIEKVFEDFFVKGIR